MDEQEQIARRVRQLSAGLEQAGVKLTHQRLQICAELARSSDHPDARCVSERVRKRVPTISLDTVYRALSTLVDLGLIDTLGMPGDRMRFDTNLATHHHFFCNRCGEVIDFQSDELDRLDVPEVARRIGSVDRLQVELRGVCAACKKADSGAP